MTRPPVVGRDGRDSAGARYLLLMRYFCEGAGPGPGLQDRTKGETNTTDFIKAGGPPCRGGGWEEGRQQKWGGWHWEMVCMVTWLAGWLQTQETLCSEFQTEINWFFVVEFLRSDIWWLVKISNYQGGFQLISILVVNTWQSSVTNLVSTARTGL